MDLMRPDSNDAESSSNSGKKHLCKDIKLIPYDYFPLHTRVSDGHILKIYGNAILKKSAVVKRNLMDEISDLKIKVITEVKSRLKQKMLKEATNQSLRYYSSEKRQFFVRCFREIKKSFASDIRRENLKKIFHVCYGSFDIEENWMTILERDIMLHFNLQYQGGDYFYSSWQKKGRPPCTSLVKCIAIAKNELVKDIIYKGSRIHGMEIRVKHVLKRPPGVFMDEFIISKKHKITCDLGKKVVIDDDTTEVNSEEVQTKNDNSNIEIVSSEKKEYEDKILDLQKKLKYFQEENKKLKKEMSVAEKEINKKELSSSKKSAQDIQNTLNSNKRNKVKKNLPTNSPTYSYLSISSEDITLVREFKERCKRNRERNAKLEATFMTAKKKCLAPKVKKKRNNIYTNCDTISPISFESSKITIDTYETNDKNSKNNNVLLTKQIDIGVSKELTSRFHELNKDSNLKTSTRAVNQKASVQKKSSDKTVTNDTKCITGQKQNSGDDDDNEYILEQIIGHKKVNGRYLFEVKWENCVKTSWETKPFLDSFVCDDVTTYLKNIKYDTSTIKKMETVLEDSDDESFSNYQQLHCVHEAICLRAENNSGYCAKGNILYNIRCADCNNVFEKLTPQNNAHICTNMGKGCKYALCEKCFTTKLLNEGQAPRRRRRTTISITL